MHLFLLLLISSCVHLYRFTEQTYVMFDEVHIGNFLTAYINNAYFFDIHPPFARLLTYVSMQFLNLTGIQENWLYTGNSLSDPIVLLRIVPIISGIMLPIVIYLICRQINMGRITSFFVSSFVIFENSLLSQSRTLMHDNWLIICGFVAILFYLRHSNRRKNISFDLIVSAVFLSFTISTKWSGLSFLLLILLIQLFRNHYKSGSGSIKKIITNFLSMLCIYTTVLFLIYISLFYVHFSILYRTGHGDPFMSREFQQTLVGNRLYLPDATNSPNFVQKFVELNARMYSMHKTVTSSHPSGSRWYTWPLMLQPVRYALISAPSTGKTVYVRYFGNPVLYWGGFLAILFMTIKAAMMLLQRNFKAMFDNRALMLILLGYFLSYLPFMAISRTMFLYHYGIALIFSIMAIGYLIDRYGGVNKMKIAIFSLFFVFLSFLFFSPFTYGIEMTKEEFENRIWISTWR